MACQNNNYSELFSDRPRILSRIPLHSHAPRARLPGPTGGRTMKSTQTVMPPLVICLLLTLASPLLRADPPTSHEDSGFQCGGEPCVAVFRGLFAFLDRDLHGLDGNG